MEHCVIVNSIYGMKVGWTWISCPSMWVKMRAQNADSTESACLILKNSVTEITGQRNCAAYFSWEICKHEAVSGSHYSAV